MKRIFYIHNHISNIVANSIIKEGRFYNDEILILYGRNYVGEVYGEYKSVRLTERENQIANIPSYGHKSLIMFIPVLLALDKKINQFCGSSEFKIYLPSTRNFLMQFFQTHKKCKEVSIIEEGLLTYTGKFYKRPQSANSFSRKALKFFRFPSHLGRSAVVFPEKTRQVSEVYTISPDMTDALQSFRVVVLKDIWYPEIPDEFILKACEIFFFDGLETGGYTSKENFFHCLQSFLRHINRSHNLYVKFHPDQIYRREIRNLLQMNQISFVEIPDQITPEAILLRSKNLTVFGFHSSLLYYATVMGHKAYSLISFLASIDPHFLENYKKLVIPAIFFEKVDMLQVVSTPS